MNKYTPDIMNIIPPNPKSYNHINYLNQINHPITTNHNRKSKIKRLEFRLNHRGPTSDRTMK